MFRTKKALFMVMTSGMLLQFGGCGGSFFGDFIRRTLLNIPVGLGRSIGAGPDLAGLLGDFDIASLLSSFGAG